MSEAAPKASSWLVRTEPASRHRLPSFCEAFSTWTNLSTPTLSRKAFPPLLRTESHSKRVASCVRGYANLPVPA